MDLYVTSEQFVTGPPGVYTLTLFHGQPSKGVTFNLHGLYPLLNNDALFLYGPLQRQALNEHLNLQQWTLPDHLSLFEIGYTKSDDLLNGRYAREDVLRELSLHPGRVTILYAPAFNEGASLREYGLEILQTLCKLSQYNIIAKLPIDCLKPAKDFHATGGVNWFEVIGSLEMKYPHFRLFREHVADKTLACADVLITCVSSIGFEFLALGKPVIFIETPRFYEISLRAFFPNVDIAAFAQRATVNGGKEFGLVVTEPSQLPQAINEVMTNPERYPPNKSALRKYLLYNAGHATEAAVDKIEELLAAKVRSRRPTRNVNLLLNRIRGAGCLNQLARQYLRPLLNRHGYDITRIGLGFLEVGRTVAAAKKRGLSICEYLENNESDSRKRGRRDRIIAELQTTGVFQQIRHVCEIGAGTGRYLEKIMELARPTIYEVYETNREWAKFLQAEYNGRYGCALTCHSADGSSLGSTASGSCDLVHTHAVFVYLPLLQSLSYLKECVRVCRPGGYIIFDFFPAETFSLPIVNAWLDSPHRFSSGHTQYTARRVCKKQSHGNRANIHDGLR